MAPAELGAENFERTTTENSIVVGSLWASWCGVPVTGSPGRDLRKGRREGLEVARGSRADHLDPHPDGIQGSFAGLLRGGRPVATAVEQVITPARELDIEQSRPDNNKPRSA